MARKLLTSLLVGGAALLPSTADAFIPGCNTHSCEKRVWTKYRKRVVLPHRPWLAKVSACESGGNPRAVGGGGIFRGKYQFMWSTWRSAGGQGDPVVATEIEQDYRAVVWATRIGWGNVHTTAGWPVCG